MAVPRQLYAAILDWIALLAIPLADRVWMCGLNESTRGRVAGEGVLRAEGDLEAAAASLTGQSRASNLRSVNRMREDR